LNLVLGEGPAGCIIATARDNKPYNPNRFCKQKVARGALSSSRNGTEDNKNSRITGCVMQLAHKAGQWLTKVMTRSKRRMCIGAKMDPKAMTSSKRRRLGLRRVYQAPETTPKVNTNQSRGGCLFENSACAICSRLCSHTTILAMPS